MGGRVYSEEFKIEAVRQVLERGYTRREVADRIGVSVYTLYEWVRKEQRRTDDQVVSSDDVSAENARLKAELKRVTEERDILKKAAAYFANQSE